MSSISPSRLASTPPSHELLATTSTTGKKWMPETYSSIHCDTHALVTLTSLSPEHRSSTASTSLSRNTVPSSIPHAPWFQLTRLLRPFHAQMAIRSKGPLSGATDIQGFWKVPEVQVNQRLSAHVILHPVAIQDRGQCCATFPLDGRGLLQRPARLWVLEIVGLLRHANDCTHSDHRG